MIPMTLDVVTNFNGRDRFKNGHFLPILHSEIQKTALTIMYAPPFNPYSERVPHEVFFRISAGAIGGGK
ncbi:hypothetical protein FRB91_003611 [Serendipita sp. 411]|nr:hypothetical protein FRB91_003611 [Serendipita sp. 411]